MYKPALSIDERIQKRIAENREVFDLLPGAVIIHDLRDLSVLHMSSFGTNTLNTTNEELRIIGPDYHRRFFNPEEAQEYVPKIYGLLERNSPDEIITFFQQIRRCESTNYEWWHTSMRILMHSDEGLPLLTLTISIPVDTEHNISVKVERLLQENNFLRRYKDQFSALTKRELEIIKLMAKDKSSGEIAHLLFLSEETVKTHRRNIKKKIGAENHYDVVKFVQAFDLL